MRADNPRRSDQLQKLQAELTRLLLAHGVSLREARELARTEADHLGPDARTDILPYLVAPHAHGWCVTRALPVTETEVFDTRAGAERRALTLAAPEQAAVFICDAKGQHLTRLTPAGTRKES